MSGAQPPQCKLPIWTSTKEARTSDQSTPPRATSCRATSTDSPSVGLVLKIRERKLMMIRCNACCPGDPKHIRGLLFPFVTSTRPQVRTTTGNSREASETVPTFSNRTDGGALDWCGVGAWGSGQVAVHAQLYPHLLSGLSAQKEAQSLLSKILEQPHQWVQAEVPSIQSGACTTI
jgi:hypothetical protein